MAEPSDWNQVSPVANRPMADNVYRVPVLIVTSLVNQPYILDLVPGQSMVEFLLRQGYDLYLIEWGRPRQEHKDLTLEDHVQGRLPGCVAQVLEHSGEKEVSIVGYCVGGLLAVRIPMPNRRLIALSRRTTSSAWRTTRRLGVIRHSSTV